MSPDDPLEKLRIADPDTYVWLKGRLDLMDASPGHDQLVLLVEETIWALSQEIGLGRTVAEGILSLLQSKRHHNLSIYNQRVRQAARTGPALARLLAVHLVPVLKADASMLARFSETINVMQSKGTYTLSEPLTVLSELLQSGAQDSAEAYLDLLLALFRQPLTYNLSVRLVYVIPKAVRSFVPQRRRAQIQQLIRIVQTDIQLIDPFLEGMEKGLALLAPEALQRFIDQALQRFSQNPKTGKRFLGLTSTLGEEACAGLQVTVPLIHLKSQIDRYLNARLGRPVGLQPLSTLAAEDVADGPMICSDGRAIYLPDEIDHQTTQAANRFLAKCLVRLEAGFFEFGTFDFDLERAADIYPRVAEKIAGGALTSQTSQEGDAERFFATFQRPDLAETLFSIIEAARVLGRMDDVFPGLMRQARPVLQNEMDILTRHETRQGPLAILYELMVLGKPLDPTVNKVIHDLGQRLVPQVHQAVVEKAGGEVSAHLMCQAYPIVADACNQGEGFQPPFRHPFGWRVRWNLVRMASVQQMEQALRIKRILGEKGLKVYRADLQRRLARNKGRLSSDDIKSLVLSHGQVDSNASVQVNGADLDWSELIKAAGIQPVETLRSDGIAFHYPEWDNQLQDYLPDFVRVQEIVVTGDAKDDFYRHTLIQYAGMVAGIRRAFEYLKPEGLALLRQWPEGDAFDYRALLDFAIDLKAGRIPSDRLFIKRIKQERDVAALLLVDLSRSTANETIGGQSTVLQVAKEALVLFCEALQVVGDTYAIAGFSGTGRHSVDYFCIKKFDEPFAQSVQGRLAALRPQRSTRMGAAIRHATAQLAPVPAKVKLLIVVTDGFPNDIGYKADYAIADTRRAAQEARARNVHVKAITVNIGSDPNLDDLYGRVHHHVISDVRDLPDKLVRLYSTLTRKY